jgi:hypothetical protein
MHAGLALLPASTMAIPAAASAHGDAELIALGKQLEIMVDAYYAARRPWARALSEAHRVQEATFGNPADRGYQDTPEMAGALEQTCQRLGTKEASDSTVGRLAGDETGRASNQRVALKVHRRAAGQGVGRFLGSLTAGCR